MGRRRMVLAPCLLATFSWGLGPMLALHYPAWTCARALPGQGSLLALLVHTHTSFLPHLEAHLLPEGLPAAPVCVCSLL